MAVYLAFSDEAGIGDPGGDFLVSGYVANELEWPWVAKAWQERVLDGPPKIPYLHMTEIRSREWRAENSISFNQAERRVDEAIRVLYGMGALSAVGSVIKRAELQEAIHSKYKRRKDIPTGLDEPDYACYMAFIAIVLLRVHNTYPGATLVNFIFEKKSAAITKGLDNVIEVTKYYLKRFQPEIAPLLGDLIPAASESELPLQAADVLCWHLQRYYGKKFNRTEENRMWMLLKERDGDLHQWPREDLEEVATALKERGKTSS